MLWSWIQNLLSFLGGLGSKKKCRLLLLGLDCAGKTTMLKMLHSGKLGSALPTNHAQAQECVIGGLTVQAWDMGGHKSARRVWNDYFAGTDAIVFLVDAHDRERFLESKEVLHQLMAAEELAMVPMLILGNKVDLPHAASEEELRHVLDICNTTGKTGTKPYPGERPIELFMCSIVKRFGYGDGFKWLAKHVN